MTRKILFPLFLLLFSCNSPAPEKSVAKPKSSAKPKPAVSKPAPSPWSVRNYVNADGEPTERKYGRYNAEGTFSDSEVSDKTLYAVILLNKENAGILLHRYKKNNPSEKFTGTARITMKNSSGEELEINSSRGWNTSGGILIEQNNNDYSRFRIFMLQSEGLINVEIRDGSSSVYHFDINAYGFGDALSQL